MRWLMLDRLEAWEQKGAAVANKTFPLSDLMFMDHFPGNPLVPGVLQIEMIAQTAGLCLKLERPGSTAVLSHVHKARFIRPVRPGDRCRVRAELVSVKTGHVKAAGSIEIEGKIVAEVEVGLAITATTAAETESDPLVEEWRRKNGNQHE